MKGFILTLALIASADATITRHAPCCFCLDSCGAVVGTVGQLDNSPVRINGPLPPAKLCIAGGSISDVNFRGCIFTRK
jgi:hypothetical protein